jgi:intracellular sulfur oxidation DsrE/DsrF family protein
MTDIKRRDVLTGLAVAGGALAAQTAAAQAQAQGQTLDMKSVKKDTDVACLYHCDFGDPARVGQMITNIDNHLSVYDYDPFKAKIVVVAHGAGIKPFLDNLEGTPWAKDAPVDALFERFKGLSKMGVDVYLCQITFRRNKVDVAKTRKDAFIKLVPSGVATVAELQAKGFAYLKVG